MRCPECENPKTRVISTREGRTGAQIRRRKCEKCGFRFTTNEAFMPWKVKD